ncbi:trafficking protein particle complex subunit 8, putative [Plasmodium ovale]|uniref:Trafficking protein particle complex subunit 8, putative n=2 Tax=Plasmodium ovale TaxID=36330 RepID=A0A1D3U909_PLAOA|nr:trafficking protein particle complex subunit 8, putative (TRS85) [Plasmodium ovale curtisi]SBS93256.1 trafficking protein particle complex subunit 8, putative (TRS85) [Plasmodium ovale curtisi]SCQ16611.1 trafficking protein particle complex subunit 8, putative [Plasmodium ovale]
MAHLIEEEVKRLIGDIYVATMLIDSSKIVRREVSFFLGVSIDDLLQPFGASTHFFNEEGEKIDLRLYVNANINYIGKNNTICEKFVENKNFKLCFINIDEYEDMKLEYVESMLIDIISQNEPQYSDIYSEKNFNVYFRKNDIDCLPRNREYFEHICANSSFLNRDIKWEIQGDGLDIPREKGHAEPLMKSICDRWNGKTAAFRNGGNCDNRHDEGVSVSEEGYLKECLPVETPFGEKKRGLGNIQKYNAFFLPWFYAYFSTSWRYTHLYNSASCPSPLGVIYICSTRDTNVIDLYKSMIQSSEKKNNVYLNKNIPKCIILVHISSNNEDEIETEVQKLFVDIQSTFLNYKCHLLIIKARRFLNAGGGSHERDVPISCEDDISMDNLHSGLFTGGKEDQGGCTKRGKKKYYNLTNVQKLYASNLSAHYSERAEDNIKVAKSANDMEESKKLKKYISRDLNKIYEYIMNDGIIYISKKIPLCIDETYFCCCLDCVDVISLKMFIHNFVQTFIVPYITTITYDINNMIVSNKKSLRNQLKFMWRKTKLNFTSSDAALFVAEQTSNVLMNVAQNALISNNDMGIEQKDVRSAKGSLGDHTRDGAHVEYEIGDEESVVQKKISKQTSIESGDDALGLPPPPRVLSSTTTTTATATPTGRGSLEWLYKTLGDVYFSLNEHELAYSILKICINEFKYEKMYFYLGTVYELASLCIYNIDSVNRKDALYYLDLSYQMFYKCYCMNNMFICSILNYYLSLISDAHNEAAVNILINANVDLSYVEEKLTSENKLTKLSFQMNNIRSGLLLEQITYSYKKEKRTFNEMGIHYEKKYDKPMITSTRNRNEDRVEEESIYERRSGITNGGGFGTTLTGSNNSGQCSGDAVEGAETYPFVSNSEVGDKKEKKTSAQSRFEMDNGEAESGRTVSGVVSRGTSTILQKNSYKHRKYLFEMTLAGHTFNKCGFKKLALFCYSKVLKKYEKKKMKHIYEHLHFMMARQAFSINLHYEALNHYICILNSISKCFEHSYVLNKNVDIYCASPEKEINFIREFAYVYKIYVDKVLNGFMKHEGESGNICNGIGDGVDHGVSNGNGDGSGAQERMNRMRNFNEEQTEGYIPPLSVNIPLVHLRNDESLFMNSVFLFKTNIYNYDKERIINYFHIYINNMFKIKNYDTTLLDVYNVMMRDEHDLSRDSLHELNYLYIMYKKFINSVYNDCIDFSSLDVISPIGKEHTLESQKERRNLSDDCTDVLKNETIVPHSEEEDVKSINTSPYTSISNKNAFATYVKEMKKKMKNCLKFTNNAHIKNIYQKTTNKEEIKINSQFIMYASKGEYLFVKFKLVNPLHTKIECHGTHICAYYYNESVNKDIVVEKRIFILEPRQAKTFILYIRPLKGGLLFISGITWHLFGLVKIYQSFYTHGLKNVRKRFDRLHCLKYDEIYACDDIVKKREMVKKYTNETNMFMWSSNIGMAENKSLKQLKNYEIDQRLLLYVYDNTHSLSFSFENVYSNQKKCVNSYEVDLIELLEGEEIEMVFKIVNNSTIPLNYLCICITPCNFFNCYEVVHNGEKYTLSGTANGANKGEEQTSYEHEGDVARSGVHGIVYTNAQVDWDKTKERRTLHVENEMYCDEMVDKNTNVFKQKFKNKNIQCIKIRGNINRKDKIYAHVKVNSNYSGLHKCVITVLCKYENEMEKKKEKKHKGENNYVKYPDMFIEKKEKCYLFIRLIHIIPLIKLKTYSLHKRNNQGTYMYFMFHNLCKNDIYLYNVLLEHKKEEDIVHKKKKYNYCLVSGGKMTQSHFTKLLNFYSSDFLYLRKNENMTSLLYTKSPLQNDLSSSFVHINWVSKNTKILRKGYIKKHIDLSNDMISFSIDDIDGDIFMNGQTEKIIKVVVNIQNNADADIENCYVQADELEAISSVYHAENDHDTDEGGDHKAWQGSTGEESDRGSDTDCDEGCDGGGDWRDKPPNAQHEFADEGEKGLPPFNDLTTLNRIDEGVDLLNGGEITPSLCDETSCNILGIDKISTDIVKHGDNCNGITGEEIKDFISHFSHRAALNDELNIAQNNIMKKIRVSTFMPVTASYTCNKHFEVSVPNDNFLSYNSNDYAKEETKKKELKENCESANSLEKGNLVNGKENKRFHDIVKYSTYVHKYSYRDSHSDDIPNEDDNLSPFVRMESVTAEGEKRSKIREYSVPLDGFLFIGIIQQYIKKLKKHESKKLYFNILFTKEGIYNINKFYVIFKLHNELFIFKPLNQLIVHVRR